MVLVTIKAVGPITYRAADFVMRDGDGNEYPQIADGKQPFLGSGSLAGGKQAKGWLSFEVPRTAKGLVVVYVAGG